MTGEAARLLDAAGLQLGGLVRWGQPIPCDKPGVYLVETPAPYPMAPIDLKAVAGWLERVPKLQLDGRRPAPHEVAERLAKFWIPSRSVSVVYIGRTTGPLAERIAAFYATPLGDRSPHAGGHWIKTLRPLREWWISWATAEDPSASEDELLTRFAATVSPSEADALFDPEHILPFANLEDAHDEGTIAPNPSDVLNKHGRPRPWQPASAEAAAVWLTVDGSNDDAREGSEDRPGPQWTYPLRNETGRPTGAAAAGWPRRARRTVRSGA